MPAGGEGTAIAGSLAAGELPRAADRSPMRDMLLSEKTA